MRVGVIFCQSALGLSPFFVSESGTFATKTVVPPASARVQSGVPSCPRALPWLSVVALRSSALPAVLTLAAGFALACGPGARLSSAALAKEDHSPHFFCLNSGGAHGVSPFLS